MTEPTPVAEFVRRFAADRDELVAARWWHEAMRHEVSAVPALADDTRRQILLLVLGGGAMALYAAWTSSGSGGGAGDDDLVVTQDALQAQRKLGWDVGASGEHLAYDGVSDVDAVGRTDWASQLESLPSALAPTQHALAPYFVPTLFQIVSAPDFRRGIVPIHTSSMDRAQAEGQALGELFRDQRDIGETALLIDASGADAVAAAAAVADLFEPVFLFDNWPHPRGVVASQEVVAAAVYYRPLFVSAAGRRWQSAPPAFVIDSRRLRPYRDQSDAFDNRYLAKLPGAAQLKGLGVRHLLYVSDVPLAHEPDDLNDDFVSLVTAGIDVKMVALSDFRPASATGPSPASAAGPSLAGSPPTSTVYYYGGSPTTHIWFWHSYGWYAPSRAAAPVAAPPPPPSSGASYRPVARSTMFSSRVVGGLPGVGKQKPSGFGRVSVRTSRTTGAVSIGSASSFGRSGSFGRTHSYWHGG